MTQFLNVHKPGERIFAMSTKGDLKAYKVQADGSISRMHPAEALAEQVTKTEAATEAPQ